MEVLLGDGHLTAKICLGYFALSLSARPGMTQEGIKASLTKTLVYDRSGDQHYDTISAFHKSVRGGDADAAYALSVAHVMAASAIALDHLENRTEAFA